MTRILVLQLCRLGDILQTTPMLRGIRREHPDAHVTLMLLNGFASAPVPRHLYDALALFPFDEVGGAMRAAPPRWEEALDRVRTFVESFDETPFDLTVNLACSPLGELLTATVPSREARGGLFAPDRTRVVRGAWMTYFLASQVVRGLGCFNLVDLFTWVAGAEPDGRGLEMDVPLGAREFISEWLRTRGVAERPLLAVQLGASDDRKRWPPEQFARMLNGLPAHAGDIVFVGTPDERPLFERARTVLTRPVLDAIGETTLPELGALLARCRLLVSNDTGTMHVAAAVGTPAVDVSTGPVFVHETGPYAEGSIAIEPTIQCFPCAAGSQCSHLSCREDLVPDEVGAVVCHALGYTELPRPPRARILKGRFTSRRRLEYQTAWSPVHQPLDALRQALAHMWEQTMPGIAPEAGQTSSAPEFDDPAALDGLAQLHLLAHEGRRLADRLRRTTGADRAALSERLAGTMRSLQLVGQLAPACQPIVAYLHVATESAAVTDVATLASIYASEFAMAGERAALLRDLLSGRAKPAMP